MVEAEAQKMVFDGLHGEVPVPEVYGWAKDGGRSSIYLRGAD